MSKWFVQRRKKYTRGRVHALMCRERYLELFDLTPGEIYTPAQLCRVEAMVRRQTVEDKK